MNQRDIIVPTTTDLDDNFVETMRQVAAAQAAEAYRPVRGPRLRAPRIRISKKFGIVMLVVALAAAGGYGITQVNFGPNGTQSENPAAPMSPHSTNAPANTNPEGFAPGIGAPVLQPAPAIQPIIPAETTSRTTGDRDVQRREMGAPDPTIGQNPAPNTTGAPAPADQAAPNPTAQPQPTPPSNANPPATTNPPPSNTTPPPATNNPPPSNNTTPPPSQPAPSQPGPQQGSTQGTNSGTTDQNSGNTNPTATDTKDPGGQQTSNGDVSGVG